MKLPDQLQRNLDQGWTLAWSPSTGWHQDRPPAVTDVRALTRAAAYRWALHTSSIPDHRPDSLAELDPLAYMEWCHALGFHPSLGSIEKAGALLSPDAAQRWVPTMVLAFAHADKDSHPWPQDYKRNWASWLSKRHHLSPDTFLGWGRATAPWLVQYIEGTSSRTARSAVDEQGVWAYTELTTRWPDMPEAVAATCANEVAKSADYVGYRRRRAPARVLNTYLSTDGLFASWRDLVRAIFGYTVVLHPEHGVVRDLTGTMTGAATHWPAALPHPLAAR